MKDFSITKGTAEVYYIRPDDGFGWGIFLLDEMTGTLSCVTDYGNYACRWGNRHGRKSFKEFLAREGKDRHYFLKNLAGQSCIEYKHDETTQNWKQCLLESRRSRYCSKDDARHIWELIDGLDDNGVLAVREMLDDKITDSVLGPDVICDTVRGYNASATCFIDKLWPMFIEVLREELPEVER